VNRAGKKRNLRHLKLSFLLKFNSTWEVVYPLTESDLGSTASLTESFSVQSSVNSICYDYCFFQVVGHYFILIFLAISVHKYFRFINSGIWLHESGVLGASPDGMVRTAARNCCIFYQTEESIHLKPDITEIKCPYSAREMTILEAVDKVKHFPLGKLIRNVL
jgi:hypothetical protein